MTAFALPASVLDAVFGADTSAELEHQADDDELLELFTDHQRARGLSPATIGCYGTLYRAFTRDLAAGGLTLLAVDRAWIGAWIAGHGKLNRSRNHYTMWLTQLFRWMQDEDHRPDLPTKGLVKAKEPWSVPRPIPAEGLRRALELADPRMRLMLTLAAYAGLRRSEITNLTREDVLDDRTPPVLLIFGKGSRERLVPIGPAVADALERYGPAARGPLFPGREPDKPLAPGTVGLLISQHLRACGIDATAHRGRHTFASNLYEVSGGDLLIVQQMLGHASVATTQIYAAWSPEKAASAIAKL